MANEKPVKKFQAGGIVAALWRNNMKLRNGEEIETLSVTVDRNYRVDGGEWKTSASLRLNDIPKAQLVLRQAYEYMATRRKSNGDAHVTQEEVVT